MPRVQIASETLFFFVRKRIDEINRRRKRREHSPRFYVMVCAYAGMVDNVMLRCYISKYIGVLMNPYQFFICMVTVVMLMNGEELYG